MRPYVTVFGTATQPVLANRLPIAGLGVEHLIPDPTAVSGRHLRMAARGPVQWAGRLRVEMDRGNEADTAGRTIHSRVEGQGLELRLPRRK